MSPSVDRYLSAWLGVDGSYHRSLQERGYVNDAPLRAFLIASPPDASSKTFRVQHLVLGAFDDAVNSAFDRLQNIVGIIDTMPTTRSRDARIPADAMSLLVRCPSER